jgi:hypothetical protein
MSDREERPELGIPRGEWPVRRLALGREPDNLLELTSAAERIAMMWPLALEAWHLAGLPIPDYARKDAPIRRLSRMPE